MRVEHLQRHRLIRPRQPQERPRRNPAAFVPELARGAVDAVGAQLQARAGRLVGEAAKVLVEGEDAGAGARAGIALGGVV